MEILLFYDFSPFFSLFLSSYLHMVHCFSVMCCALITSRFLLGVMLIMITIHVRISREGVKGPVLDQVKRSIRAKHK